MLRDIIQGVLMAEHMIQLFLDLLEWKKKGKNKNRENPLSDSRVFYFLFSLARSFVCQSRQKNPKCN